MSPIDFAPPAILAPAPKLWTPAKPYIIRASEDDHEAVKAMPFLSAIAGGARRRDNIRLRHIGGNGSTADQTTYDLGNFTIPEPGLVIVGAAGRHQSTNRSVSSISIGGTNGTLHAASAAGLNHLGIASRVVSAGDHNVSVTFSGGTERAACYVWLLTNYNSATPAGSDANQTSSNVTTRTATFDIPARGFALYFHINRNSSGTPSWSSATSVWNNVYEVVFDAAFKYTDTALTSHAETVTFASNQAGIVGASWA